MRRAAFSFAGALAVLAITGCGGSSTAVADRSFHPVAGNFKPDETLVQACNDDSCYEQAFGNLSFKRGPKTALVAFARAMQTNRAVESDCHRIVHMIGSAALARYRGNIARAFSEGASTCWSGYYHGILERAFIGARSRLEMGSIARRVCEDSTVRASTWLAYQCLHGLGHGLMIQSGYDLRLALAICDDLRTDWDRTSCYGGTFMENLSSTYGVRSRFLKDDDLVYPCDAVPERQKSSCYLLVTSRILTANHYNWRAAAVTCEGVEQRWMATCFQSYGRDASGFTRQNPARIIGLCAIAGRGRHDCLYGAARDVTANDAGGARAAQLCRLTSGRERNRCFDGIGTIVGTLETSMIGRREACSRVAGPDAPACLRGAGVPS